MPSTTSSSVSSDLASSTVITPSLPTFFIASARKRPISASPLAEMVPTCAISSFEVTFLEFFCRSATIASTARSTPRLRSIGFIPAATALAPVTPALVMRGAPYDLSSTTLRPLGPSVTRTAWARVSMPRNMLSRASTENLTSLAAILMSFQPWIPVLRDSRCAAYSGRDVRRSGGLPFGHGLIEHAHDVALLHDQEFNAFNLDLGARPFAEQHVVADL